MYLLTTYGASRLQIMLPVQNFALPQYIFQRLGLQAGHLKYCSLIRILQQPTHECYSSYLTTVLVTSVFQSSHAAEEIHSWYFKMTADGCTMLGTPTGPPYFGET